MSSPLARSQAQTVLDRIAKPKTASCRLEILAAPDGDHDRDQVFLALSPGAIRFLADQLLAGKADLAVVEAADVSLPLPAGLAIHCVLGRATPFEAYLNRQGMIMDEMDPGSRIGVMTLRARTQMAPQWPDLEFSILRGGVDRAMETHLRQSAIDGLVIPAAVTENLGIQSIVAEIFAPDFILPSPGQGILVVIGRADDDEARRVLAPLHSTETEVELLAERAFCDHMVKDQDLPVGALATVSPYGVQIVGATGDCANRFVVTGAIEEAEAVGKGLAAQILGSGASLIDLLEAEFADGESVDPTDPDDPDDPGQPDEVAVILSEEQFSEPDDDAEPAAADLDDIEHIKAWEDLAGIAEEPDHGADPDEDEDDDYD